MGTLNNQLIIGSNIRMSTQFFLSGTLEVSKEREREGGVLVAATVSSAAARSAGVNRSILQQTAERVKPHKPLSYSPRLIRQRKSL